MRHKLRGKFLGIECVVHAGDNGLVLAAAGVGTGECVSYRRRDRRQLRATSFVNGDNVIDLNAVGIITSHSFISETRVHVPRLAIGSHFSFVIVALPFRFSIFRKGALVLFLRRMESRNRISPKMPVNEKTVVIFRLQLDRELPHT